MIELFLFVSFVFVLVRHRFYWKVTEGSLFEKETNVFMAHRGQTYNVPENTLESFQDAIKKGFDWIELDLVTTKDGIIVCSHNFDLERETNGKGWINETDSAALDYLRTGVYTHPSNTKELPLLKNVVLSLPKTVGYNFELKTFTLFDFSMIRPLMALIKEEKIEKYVVSSFNPFLMGIIKLFYPFVKTGFLLEERKYLWFTHWIHPNYLHPRADMVDDELIKLSIDHNIEISVWTVNSTSGIQWCKDNNIKGIITDSDAHSVNYI